LASATPIKLIVIREWWQPPWEKKTPLFFFVA
jgi:hypothetical protein